MPLYVEIRLENIGFWYQSWKKMYLVKNTGKTYRLKKKAGKMNFSVRGLRWALTISFSLEKKRNIKLLESKLSLWKANLCVCFISIFWLTKHAINIKKDFE